MNDLITEILKREGWDKFTNRPTDRGGPTKWGITQKAWSGYLGRSATIDDVKSITETQARVFYLNEYVVKPRFDLFEDDIIREFVIDCGVNHGVRRASKWVQFALGVKVDGFVGPKTLLAANLSNEYALLMKLVSVRVQFYGKLVTRDPSQAEYAWGWARRAASFLDLAAAQLGG